MTKMGFSDDMEEAGGGYHGGGVQNPIVET